MRENMGEKDEGLTAEAIGINSLFEGRAQITDFALSPIVSFKTIEAYIHPTDGMVIGVVCNGTAKMTVDGRHFELHPNSLFILRDISVVSDFRCSKACRGYLITYSNSFFYSAKLDVTDMLLTSIAYGFSPCLQVTEQDVLRLHDIAAALSRAVAIRNNQYDDKACSSLFAAFFYAISSIVNKYALEQVAEETMPTRADSLLRDFFVELGVSCERERSVEYYASKVGVTPKYLSLVCKKRIGFNASQIIDAAVIGKAKELLEQHGMSVLEVSERLNFVSQSFFGKYFKQRTGVSPSRYKAQH